jgi:hypothetical protein
MPGIGHISQLTSYSNDGLDRFPSASGPLVLADVPVKRREEKDSDEDSMYSIDAGMTSATITDQCHVDRLKIDVLPDDVLICIFNLYRQGSEPPHGSGFWPWRALVHV